MVKGRNTRILGARVADGLHRKVEAAAQGRGWTISEYLKWVLSEHFAGEAKYEGLHKESEQE